MTGATHPVSVERILGILAITLAVPVGIAAWNFGVGTPRSPGAGFWPLSIAVLMFGLGLVMTLKPAPAADDEPDAGESRWSKFGISLATLVFYVALLEPLGYLLTTALTLFAQLRFVEDQSWRTSLLTSTLAAAISLVVFKVLLKVALPVGVLPLPAGW